MGSFLEPIMIQNKQAKDTTEKGRRQESHSALQITNVAVFLLL